MAYKKEFDNTIVMLYFCRYKTNHLWENKMAKGIKGRGRTHSTSRAWEKALKKNGNKKNRAKAKNALRNY